MGDEAGVEMHKIFPAPEPEKNHQDATDTHLRGNISLLASLKRLERRLILIYYPG
jgi:hypothetical protein